MSSDSTICPFCKWPVVTGAVFCDNCGKNLPAATPQPCAPQPCAPEVADVQPGRPPRNEPRTPFTLEWDERRQFIEGVRCHFAFRLRIRVAMKSLVLKVDVDGETIDCEPWKYNSTGPRAYDEREGTIPFVPKMAGAISVRALVEVLYENGCRESFEAVRPFEHQASPFRRFLSDGDRNVSIDIRDNDGLIRLDDLKLSSRAITDLKDEITQTLANCGGWKDVPMAYGDIDRERVHLSFGSKVLTVVPGGDRVCFGRNAHRAAVPLAAVTADGQIDKSRSFFISRVHFTILRGDRGVVIRDGSPSDGSDRKNWSVSSHGISINDKSPESVFEYELVPGRTVKLVLAPNSVPGGALTLLLEARGHDAEVSGVDCFSNLASVVMRYDNESNRPALVVWSEAGIDELLGTNTGLRVGLVRGRLCLIRRDGSTERLIHLAGGMIPGTGISVQ